MTRAYGWDRYFNRVYNRTIDNWTDTKYFKYNFQAEAEEVLTSELATAVIKDIADQMDEEVAKILRDYSAKMLRRKSTRPKLQKLHEDLARGAEKAVVAKYKREVSKRPSYRWLDRGKMKRFSNKALLEALQRSGLFIGDATGIGVVNVAHLDPVAKQWYRLNFGAAPATSKRMVIGKGFELFGKTSTKKISLDQFGPGRPFFVPNTKKYGKWSSDAFGKTPSPYSSKDNEDYDTLRNSDPASRPTGLLYIVPKTVNGSFASRLSKGITGMRFLDAGVKYINDNYGDRLEQLIREEHGEAIDAARGKLK
jgi:hypothetical protein